MFYIIDTKEQLERVNLGDDVFVHIVPKNGNYHPVLQEISLIYIKWVHHHKGYILCLNHSESLSLNLYDVFNKINESDRIFVHDKKTFMHLISINPDKIYDLSIYSNLNNINKVNLDNFSSKVESDFRNRFINKDYNVLIPISKHYEKLEKIYNAYKNIINNFTSSTPYDFINTLGVNLFYNIEKSGIKLDKNKFINHFSQIENPKFSISKGKIYTQYNLNTTTCRPSNTFNNINFAALNKNNKEREIFTPENDYFVEIDFSAYHPNIIAKLIKYEYDANINFYQYLSAYFNNKSIDEVKLLTFHQLYGGISEEYKNVPYFNMVDNYTKNIWEQIQNLPISSNKYSKTFNIQNIKNPTPSKLLNYITQNNETIFNIIQFNSVLNILNNKKTKIVLYTYDSILLDYKEDENLLNNITEQLIFKHSVKKGTNYNDMIKINY